MKANVDTILFYYFSCSWMAILFVYLNTMSPPHPNKGGLATI